LYRSLGLTDVFYTLFTVYALTVIYAVGYIEAMTTIYEVITDPTRRRILDLLRERPRLVGELVDALNISQPGISKHLRVLREAGLVDVRQDAQRRWYILNPVPLAEVDRWLADYRQLWEARFDRLDRYLQSLQEQPHDDE
jgi:DNA-binding transcriptional ArsR family regulator